MVFRPSSGAQICTYSVRFWSDKYLMLYVQFWTPDDGRKIRLKHVQRLTEINKLWNAASCWLHSANDHYSLRITQKCAVLIYFAAEAWNHAAKWLMKVLGIRVFQVVENVIFVSVLQSLSKTLKSCPDISGHTLNTSIHIFSVNGTFKFNIPSTVSRYFVE